MASIGGAPTYTASYDAAGNMTCRAPTTATTCAGTPTGATLSYDTQGRLTGWSGGTVTDSFLYDGAGNRVAQQVTVNGTSTTTTTYVDGGQEEIATSGSSSTLTKYFPGKDGTPVAERIGTSGALTYLASDGQGSVSAVLDSTGNVTFQQLYTPYGSVRYSNGASPTAFGYTGQRADAATGLDYYHARYYDPVAQQFVSADSVRDGLSRYGYVGGNPETATDPSGHLATMGPGGGYSEAAFQADLVTWEAAMRAKATKQVQYTPGKYIAPSNIVDQTGGNASAAVLAAATTAAIAQDQNGGFEARGVNAKGYSFQLQAAGAGVVTITYPDASNAQVTKTFYSPAVVSSGGPASEGHAETQIFADLAQQVNAWFAELIRANGIGIGDIYMSFNAVTGNPTCDKCAEGGSALPDGSFEAYISRLLSLGKYLGATWVTVSTYYVSPYAVSGSGKQRLGNPTPSTTTSYLYLGYTSEGLYNAMGAVATGGGGAH